MRADHDPLGPSPNHPLVAQDTRHDEHAAEAQHRLDAHDRLADHASTNCWPIACARTVHAEGAPLPEAVGQQPPPMKPKPRPRKAWEYPTSKDAA